MPTEKQLEQLIEADPTVLGKRLLIIGRQVTTSYGRIIDLLAVDADGQIHVLELKRDRTPREVVAQLLDYGSWVADLGYGDLVTMFSRYGKAGDSFEAAFERHFDSPAPEELNKDHVLTIVASEVNPSTERIVGYLVDRHSVPINAVFFRYFEDSGHRYLARTWLRDQEEVAEKSSVGSQGQTKEPWNGRDWYVSFGVSDTRSWEDAVRYGFVSAGGGDWYERSIHKLPVGARVFVYIPKVGYVGVGTVTGEAVSFDQAEVVIDGHRSRLADLSLDGTYQHADGDEWIVPIRWIATRPADRAVKRPGLFANQNSATRLRNKFTLDVLTQEFEIPEDGTA